METIGVNYFNTDFYISNFIIDFNFENNIEKDREKTELYCNNEEFIKKIYIKSSFYFLF